MKLEDGKVVETKNVEVDLDALLKQRARHEGTIAAEQQSLADINAKIDAIKGLGFSEVESEDGKVSFVKSE